MVAVEQRSSDRAQLLPDNWQSDGSAYILADSRLLSAFQLLDRTVTLV